jgi:hypothetical protein
MDKLNNLVAITQHAIEQALERKSLITEGVLNIDGMSSPKVRHFFNNLIHGIGEDARYLEVGLWKGSTFISALYNNNYRYAVGIENFSQWNETSRDECLINLKDFLGAPNLKTELIEDRFEDVVIDKKFNVFFYDGYHSTEAHEYAFDIANKNLDDSFVMIVDDWNWEGVRVGTWKAINKLHYTLPRFWELYAQSGRGDLENWWNGLFVAVVEKGTI